MAIVAAGPKGDEGVRARVAPHAYATAFEHNVVGFAHVLEVGSHIADVKEAQLWLVPRQPVARVCIKECLQVAASSPAVRRGG